MLEGECWNVNHPRVSLEFPGVVLLLLFMPYYFLCLLFTTYYLHIYLQYYIYFTFSCNWDTLPIIINLVYIYDMAFWTHIRHSHHTKCNSEVHYLIFFYIGRHAVYSDEPALKLPTAFLFLSPLSHILLLLDPADSYKIMTLHHNNWIPVMVIS